MNFIFSKINFDIGGAGGFVGGIGVGGLGTVALMFFTGLGLIPIILAGVTAGIAGSFCLGLLDIDGINNQIKSKVRELGFQKFKESTDEIADRLYETVCSVFSNRVKVADKAITQIISCYENLLAQQEKAHKETLEQRDAEKAWIAQQRRELEQVQNQIEAILNQSAG